MSELIFPTIGILIVIISFIFAYKNRHTASKFISCLLIGILFSTFFMVLPTAWGNADDVSSLTLYSILSSLFYSFDSLGAGQDISQLESIDLVGFLKGMYIIINYILFALAPVLTSGLVLSFFGDMGERMRYSTRFCPKCYVFSELNENSLCLAKAIKKSPEKKAIVFCSTKNTDKVLLSRAKQLGAVTLHKPCENIKLTCRFKTYAFFLSSDDEDNNIKTSQVIISKNRNIQNRYLIVNVFAESGINISALEHFMKKTPCHIFSELNEKLLAIATEIKANEKIVFCNTKNCDSALCKKAHEKGFVLSGKPWQKIDPIKELGDHDFLLYRQNEKRAELKVFKNRFTTGWADDRIRLRFIDKMVLFCNNLLFEYPLYNLPDERKDISVMLVGCGKLGMRMLKTVVWCGQTVGYSLKIRVYDKDSKKAEKEFYKQAPELKNYDIKFTDADVENDDFKEKISDSLDATFVFIATGDDSLNISSAEYLYRIFRQNNSFDYTPPIFTRVRENIKSSIFENENSYLSERKINLFGTVDSIYSNCTLFNSKFENLSFAVHLSYWDALNIDENSFLYKKIRNDFLSSEYDRRSSMASALHICSKLHSCGLLAPDEHDLTNEKATEFEKLISKDPSVIEKLAINEHERWNAFMRSEGYQKADMETVKAYAYKNMSHKDELSKLHPCLVSWDELDDVSAKYNELKISKSKNFKDYDKQIVKNIPEIIRKANKLNGGK